MGGKESIGKISPHHFPPIKDIRGGKSLSIERQRGWSGSISSCAGGVDVYRDWGGTGDFLKEKDPKGGLPRS